MTDGKIVNKKTGLEIPVKDYHNFDSGTGFSATIEGDFERFWRRQYWDFVPDPKPIPTAPGVYVLDNSNVTGPYAYTLAPNGEWWFGSEVVSKESMLSAVDRGLRKVA